MTTQEKLAAACTNLRKLEAARRMTGKRRRRASYWLRRVSRLERQEQRAFQRELWSTVFGALEAGKIQSLHIL